MRKRFVQEAVSLLDVLKWVVLATIVGVIVGSATAVFLKALHVGVERTGHIPYFFMALPAVLFINALFMRSAFPESDVYTTDKVIDYVHRKHPIPGPSILKSFLGSLLTIAAGGSAGREAPAADMGGGLGSLASRLFFMDREDQQKLAICGVSAGFAAAFGTPISGAIFGVEVLFVGVLMYDVLLPAFVAGVVGYQVASAFGSQYVYHPISFVPKFTNTFFLEVICAGICFGICSLFLIGALRLGHRLAARFRIPLPWKGAIGGVALIGLTLVFGTRYLGLGIDTIQSTFQGSEIVWYAFLLKMVFTSVTLNFGGTGGIVTPILFIGATCGAVFAQLFGLDTATFAAIGLVAVLAGAANTPIAASIMAVELFGAEVTPYAAIACMISFLMTGYKTVFPSQIVKGRKAKAIEVQLEQEIEHLKPHVQLEETSFFKALDKISHVISDQFIHHEASPVASAKKNIELEQKTSNGDDKHRGLGMQRIKKFMGFVPEEDREGIRFSRDNAWWVISGFRSFPDFLRNLPGLFPEGSVLYLEGTVTGPNIRNWLKEKSMREPAAKVAVKTRWPRPKVFHVALNPKNMSDLASLAESAESYNIVNTCEHLHVYHDDTVLLEAHYAASRRANLSGDIPEERVKEFCAKLRCSYKKQEMALLHRRKIAPK